MAKQKVKISGNILKNTAITKRKYDLFRQVDGGLEFGMTFVGVKPCEQ